MNRKASICVVLVFALACLVALGAGAQGKGLSGGKLGLVFNVANILLGIQDASFGAPATATPSAGLGLKYWLAEKMALRGILEFNFSSDSTPPGTSSMAFGLSGAFEYHFLKAKVSPYVGGLAGIRLETATGQPNDFSFFLGGILGAEVTLLDYLALFAEYNLRLYFNDPNFDINLGVGNNAAAIGLIIYLP